MGEVSLKREWAKKKIFSTISLAYGIHVTILVFISINMDQKHKMRLKKIGRFIVNFVKSGSNSTLWLYLKIFTVIYNV